MGNFKGVLIKSDRLYNLSCGNGGTFQMLPIGNLNLDHLPVDITSHATIIALPPAQLQELVDFFGLRHAGEQQLNEEESAPYLPAHRPAGVMHCGSVFALGLRLQLASNF